MKNNIIEILKEKILVCDGATGTMLFAKGIPPSAGYEYLNIQKPDIIENLHREYIDAGSDIIETNTFAANCTKLITHKKQSDIKSINYQGAKIARKAAGDNVYVAGSIGPLGKTKPEEQLSFDDIYEIYKEQAVPLLEGGIDLFILETFSNLEHIKIALSVCKKLSNLPVICQMAYLDDNKTNLGYDIYTITESLESLGADVIGANCGSGPSNILEVVKILASITEKPVSAQPNAGYPQIIEGRTMYLTTPQYFAEYALNLVDSGANMIGGCCGTTPEHIKLIAQRVRDKKPVKRILSKPQAKIVKPETRSLIEEKIKNKGFIIVVEMAPPKTADIKKAVYNAKLLKSNGAEIVSFPENPLAQVRMNSIAVASIVKRETGLEPIFHYTCRDRNTIGLQSDLLGADALDLHSVLAVTGDPTSLGNHPEATSVYDLNSIKLVQMIDNMNKTFDLKFFTGVAFNPNVKNIEIQIERLKKKINAGAKFAMTQPMFDIDKILEMVYKTEKLGIPILVGILPLASKKNTEFLHNEVPGMEIPESIRKRMDIEDKDKAAFEGFKIALEIIKAVKDKIQGLYLMPSLGRYDIAARILEELDV